MGSFLRYNASRSRCQGYLEAACGEIVSWVVKAFEFQSQKFLGSKPKVYSRWGHLMPSVIKAWSSMPNPKILINAHFNGHEKKSTLGHFG